MDTGFTINVLDQGWLNDSPPELDLCSHGHLALEIGGVQIEEGKEDYGISESALALLRTLQDNHTADHPVAQQMIFHGCGAILMMGCPIGINWVVEHVGQTIHIFDVVKYPTTNEADAIQFSGLGVEVSFPDYAKSILSFAREAKSIFGEKKFFDDHDQRMYVEFLRCA